MITTVVTTSTVTVTTMIGFGMVLGLGAVITLIVFLGVKELAGASGNSTPRLLAKSLDIGIVPLTIAFAMIVAMAVVRILV